MNDQEMERKLARLDAISQQSHASINALGDFKKVPSAYVPLLLDATTLGLSLLGSLIQKMQAAVLQDEGETKVGASAARCMARAEEVLQQGESSILESAESAIHLPYDRSPLRGHVTEMTFEHMSENEKLLLMLRVIMLSMMQVERSWLRPAMTQVYHEAKGNLTKSEVVDPATHPCEDDDEEAGQ